MLNSRESSIYVNNKKEGLTKTPEPRPPPPHSPEYHQNYLS